MTWKAKTASSWPGSDVFSAWPPWTTGPFLRFSKIMQQCCSWKRSCHKEPPGVTFMPSSAYHKSQFETAVGDVGMLRAAWESAAEVSLPYAAWLCIAELQLEETFWTL